MPLTSPHLIDQLLADQQSLSAVEAFSQKHDSGEVPAQEKYYKDLLPIRPPNRGEQYAFEVDLDACTGCKACVAACHSLNGLDENESWRDVGILSGGSEEKPLVQTVTSACHHCVDPACLNGCPTMAYEKDENTGIVRHLDDQCIGCQYCILKCPYDVPKYNKNLGIVRKCDMCIDRLKKGEAPACVQSCPSGAIKIRLIETNEILSRAETPQHAMIAGAFQSDYTKPTTTFRRKTPLPNNISPADERDLTPQHAHLPLVWMLTLTQIGAGIFAAAALLAIFTTSLSETASLWLAITGSLFAIVGIGSSVLHLGSPMGAWRSFLGLKTSWLSREIIVFGGWPPLALTLVGLHFLKLDTWTMPATLATCGVSLLGVFCSVMVYADTRRDFWRIDRTLARFFGTVFLGGSAAAIGILTLTSETPPPSALYLMLGLGALLCISVDALSLLPAREKSWSYAKRSARVQLAPLRKQLVIRWGALLSGFVLISISPLLGAALLLTGEWFAHYLFFTAVTAPKMPGNINS